MDVPEVAWCAIPSQQLSIAQRQCCKLAPAAVQGRALRRKQREEAQREALLQAQKASYRHRSRFQRALGSPPPNVPTAELDVEEYDGLPESSFSQPAHRCIAWPSPTHIVKSEKLAAHCMDLALGRVMIVACATWEGQLDPSTCRPSAILFFWARWGF